MTEVEGFSIYSSGDEANDGTSNVYEPDPKLIAKLYGEIKEKKILSLDWKSMGRMTQSEYEQENKAENTEKDYREDKQGDSKDDSNLIPDFDFDEDFDTDVSKLNPLIKKKPTQVSKKVTDLNNVMNNIKKYQKIGKQTKSSSEEDKV